MTVYTTPRTGITVRTGYAAAAGASAMPGSGPGPAVSEETWGRFERRRHRMKPPDLFDEASKKFEKYEQLVAASPEREPSRGPSVFPDVASGPDSASVAAAASASAAREQRGGQKQLDADLGLRKARFFDNCLRADRALESPRPMRRSPPFTAREPRASTLGAARAAEEATPPEVPVRPTSGLSMDSPRANTTVEDWAQATQGSFSMPPDGEVPSPTHAEELPPPTLEESVGCLVNQCRRVRLYPATTGIVRPAGESRLQLEYGFLTDERAEAMNDTLKAASSDIREALFRSNGLTEKGAANVLDALPVMVEHVDLSQNDLSHGEGVWCKAFKKLEQLKCLTLSDCQLTDGVCKELLRALPNCRALTKLDLSVNLIAGAGTSMRALLKGHPSLEELNMHWNHLSGESARALVRGLVDNAKHGGKLHDVNLSWNPIGKLGAEETCHSFVKLFTETSTLRHLDISKCDLSAACCQILADGLKENSSIVGIHVSGNEARLDPQGNIVPNSPAAAAPQDPSAPGPAGAGAGGAEEAKAEAAKITKMTIEEDQCCWLCQRWRETRLCYVPGVSGPDVPDVWVFTAIDGFQTPIKMQKVGEEFVTHVIAAPGPLRYFFQAGSEVLCSKMAPQVDMEEMMLAVRAGVGLYPGTSIKPEKSPTSGLTMLKLKRARAPGEPAEDEVLPEPPTSPAKGRGAAEVKPEAEEVPKVSLEVEIDTFSTTMVVARPPDEPLCRAFVPRRPGELKGNFPPQEWNIERSLFAPHHEALSIRSFCERCFEADWRNAEAGMLAKDEADRNAIKDVLRAHYAEIKVLYSSLCSVDWRLLQLEPEDRPCSLAFGLTLNEYTHMLVQHNLVGEELSLADADAQFIVAAVPPADISTWFEAFCMEGHMVQRHSFFGLLVRLAACFARSEASSKSKGKSDRVSKSLQNLLNKHIMYPYPPMKNNFRCVQWRVDVLHTEVVESVLRKHMKAVVDPLFLAFARTDGALGQKRHLRPEDWFRLLDALGAFPCGKSVENAQMNAWDRVWLWQVSAMTQIDELTTSRSLELVFVEYLEALARLVGLMKSRRSAGEVKAESDESERWDYGMGAPSAPSIFCLDKGVVNKVTFAEYLDSFLSSPEVKQAIAQA